MKYLLLGVSLILGGADSAGVRAPIIPVAQRRAAPDYQLADAASTQRTPSRYRGKVVLLDFWAIECGGCKVEIPWFMEFKRAYTSSGFEVVGVSMDISYEGLKDATEAWSKVKPFVKTHRINYPILMGDDAVIDAYEIKALPVSYLIDRNGRIAAKYVGLVDRDDIERNIKTLLNEPRS